MPQNPTYKFTSKDLSVGHTNNRFIDDDGEWWKVCV